MPNDAWADIEALEGLIVKAVWEGTGNSPMKGDIFCDLLMEGKVAAYEALKRYDPQKGEKTAYVFQSVVHHIRRVSKTTSPSANRCPTKWRKKRWG